MAELSKVWHFLFWNKLGGHQSIGLEAVWNGQRIIISNWFRVFCCKHTPGNIFQIFNCKSPGTELSQTGRGSPLVEWWNPGFVFLAPCTHPHPPTPSLPPVSPAGRVRKYLTLQKCRNMEQPEGRKGLREGRQSLLPISPPCTSCQEVMSPPGSLPPGQLPLYQGALQFLKELVKSHHFLRPQWRDFSWCLSTSTLSATRTVWKQYLLSTLKIQPNICFPVFLLWQSALVTEKRATSLESSNQTFSSQNRESSGWLA